MKKISPLVISLVSLSIIGSFALIIFRDRLRRQELSSQVGDNVFPYPIEECDHTQSIVRTMQDNLSEFEQTGPEIHASFPYDEIEWVEPNETTTLLRVTEPLSIKFPDDPNYSQETQIASIVKSKIIPQLLKQGFILNPNTRWENQYQLSKANEKYEVSVGTSEGYVEGTWGTTAETFEYNELINIFCAPN